MCTRTPHTVSRFRPPLLVRPCLQVARMELQAQLMRAQAELKAALSLEKVRHVHTARKPRCVVQHQSANPIGTWVYPGLFRA
jgi:hypothetical protein